MDGRTEVTRTWFDKLTTNGLLFHATTLPMRPYSPRMHRPARQQPSNHPIGQLQPLNAVKLAQIVRYQRQPFTAGMGGNVQIIDTDRLTLPFQCTADAAVMLCRFGPVRQHIKTGTKIFHYAQRARWRVAFFRASQQFGQRNR